VYDVYDAVDLFNGGVLLPEAKLMIGYPAGLGGFSLGGVFQKFLTVPGVS
jgi:hypothetical protein